MLALGFGFVEAGTVTPRPQPGNPGQRLFRLTEDEAVINRFGFNSCGVAPFAGRLAKRRAAGTRGIVGANLGKNRDSDRRRRRLHRLRRGGGAARRLSRGQRLLAEHARASRVAGTRRRSRS